MKGPGEVGRRFVVLAAACAVIVLAGSCGGGGENPEPKGAGGRRGGSGADASGSAATDHLTRAEQAMGTLDDYTFRGTTTLPVDASSPFAGEEIATTQHVAGDSCETVISLDGVVQMTRRNIDGTTYQQLSPALLESSGLDASTQAQLNGRWTAAPGDPAANCDMTRLSESLDLDSIHKVGPAKLRGRDAIEYVAAAKTDDRVSVRIWIATGDEPLVLRISGGMGGVDLDQTLVSFNDGLAIKPPTPDLIVEPQN